MFVAGVLMKLSRSAVGYVDVVIGGDDVQRAGA